MDEEITSEGMPVTRRQIIRALPLCEIESRILYRSPDKELALEVLEDSYKDVCFWMNKFGIDFKIRTQGNPVIRKCNMRGLSMSQIEEMVFGRHLDADLAFEVIENSYLGVQKRLAEIANGTFEKPYLTRHYEPEFPALDDRQEW